MESFTSRYRLDGIGYGIINLVKAKFHWHQFLVTTSYNILLRGSYEELAPVEFGLKQRILVSTNSANVRHHIYVISHTNTRRKRKQVVCSQIIDYDGICVTHHHHHHRHYHHHHHHHHHSSSSSLDSLWVLPVSCFNWRRPMKSHVHYFLVRLYFFCGWCHIGLSQLSGWTVLNMVVVFGLVTERRHSHITASNTNRA